MSDPFQTPSPFQQQPSYSQQSPPQQAQPYQQTPPYQQAPPSYQQQAPYQQQQVSQPAAQPGLSDNAAGGLAYVTIIPAIVFLALAPYNKSSYVRFHSWQSIFLTIAAAVAWAVLMVIGMIPVFNLIDLFLGPLIWLAFFILWIVLLVKTLSGASLKLPIIGELAEKQAGSPGTR